MFLEPIFVIQKKFNKGVLHRILKKSKQKELIIKKIHEKAIDNDFIALYLISINRKIFDKDVVSLNDFKLNAISEIVAIMNKGEGDTGFQNEVLNYLMQVKDIDFLIYILDNLLKWKRHFYARNIQVFILTLSSEFKSAKLNNKEKNKLMNVIHRHFLAVDIEIQEVLVRMMEVLKIVDVYKAAELFNLTDQSIKKRLMDAIKGSISIKKASEIIGNINASLPNSNLDDNYALLFIIAIEKYKLYETINTIIDLKDKRSAWNDITNKLHQLADENLIDQNRFIRLFETFEMNIS